MCFCAGKLKYARAQRDDGNARGQLTKSLLHTHKYQYNSFQKPKSSPVRDNQDERVHFVTACKLRRLELTDYDSQYVSCLRCGVTIDCDDNCRCVRLDTVWQVPAIW